MAALGDGRNPARHSTGEPGARRWVILGVIALAQLMVVLDTTVVNIALPSAQRALHFTNVDRQWIVTAYALAFGSLLLLGGKLADLLGRKVTFLLGVLGFAAASAAGGAATSFSMLVAARAFQGVFGAFLAPSALSLLTTTFSNPKERGKAFGVYSAVAGAGGAVGLLLGGVLTEYLSWRWSLYINVVFAGIAATGAMLLLRRQPSPGRPRVDLPGAALVSGGMFCIVYGFSNAALHSWHTPSTWGFLSAGGVVLVLFGAWQARARQPLLPPRVVADRNRAGAYLSMLIAAVGMFSMLLFLTYYMQLTLGFSPVITGVAFLPMIGVLMVTTNVANIVLLPRTGPRPLIPLGMLVAAAGMALLTRIGVHSHYTPDVLPALMVVGLGLGLVFAPVFNTGTYGVAPSDAGVASATVNTGQQIGGSIGISLLNTIAASATASYITAHITRATAVHGRPSPALTELALVHGYTRAFWVSAAIFAGGMLVSAAVLRSGPLPRPAGPQAGDGQDAPAATAGRAATPVVAEAGAPTTADFPGAFWPPWGGPGVQGHVRRADGAPVPGAILTLISLDGQQAGRALSSQDGAFRMPAPRVGTYTLIAIGGGHQPRADTVLSGGQPADHDVIMQGASSLAGTVRRTGTGEPLAGAALSLAGTRGEIVAGRATDEAGRYLFEDLIPGGYTLAVTASRHQPAALPVTIADGQQAIQDAELDGGSTVRGSARTTDGTTVPNARITLIDKGGSVVTITATSADGTYSIDNVPTGNYTVIASGYPPVASAVKVTVGPAHVHDVRLGYPEE